MNIIKFNLIYTFFEVFMKIFFLYTFVCDMIEISHGKYRLIYFSLYKGIYNFEAVFPMDSRIPKGFVCASVF